MQRKIIDEVEFAVVETELVDKEIFLGDLSVVLGRHSQHGQTILIQSGGVYVALADTCEAIRSRDDPIESDG